jgi:hypothetical protein
VTVTVAAYRRTTVYLTEEQSRWLRRLTAQAQLDDLPLSASDVIRLALDELARIPEHQLRSQLVSHVRDEVTRYPGRAKRGLPGGGSGGAEASRSDHDQVRIAEPQSTRATDARPAKPRRR